MSTPKSKGIEFQRICLPIRDIRYSKSTEQIKLRDVDIDQRADEITKNCINSINDKVREAIDESK